MHWYQKDIKDVMDDLGTSEAGLSSLEAKKRLQEYGPNELKEKKRKTPFQMFLEQFKDFLIIVLIFAALIAGIVGKPTDAIAILAIVILNAIIGFVQEYKAEQAMASLKKMAAPMAVVLRDGLPVNIPASEIVPGDIVFLEAGQIVPADMRLRESANLKVEEASLTGESVPVEKHTKVIHEEHLPIGDRKNMVYQGTIVTYGRGSGIVVATGMETEMGKIASMLQEAENLKTPLQKRLALFGKKLAIAIFAICAIIFSAGLMRGEDVFLMLLTAISLAVAAIPEALPAVITIALALGAKKMVKQKALIRKLPAVESLGSVTYICSDKTGTLTLNKMSVEEVYVDGSVSGVRDLKLKVPEKSRSFFSNPQSLFFTAVALCNDSKTDVDGNVLGDPTEIALYNVSKEVGYLKEELERLLPRVKEIPFDPERKCMTTFHRVGSEYLNEFGSNFVSFTKGAVDVLLEKSDYLLTSEGLMPVDRSHLHKINDRMAADGLRVLCVAMRKWEDIPLGVISERIESNLTILGFVGMMDPPREEAAEAIRMCIEAGIKPVMITGDHPITAVTIAKRLGLIEDNAKSVITGRELDKLSLQEFEEKVENIRVYARVAPEHKFKIVKALQDKGQIVAMTGDGVNDAPALKQADIGVAMGITGTEVSKEASAMILLDDNFSTIVKAVKEGRRIYDNILKFIKYSMTSNAGTVWAIFLAPFFGLPLPLLPIQILWMNLLCDSLPGLSLTAEPAESGVMKRPPRDPEEGVFAKGRGYFIIIFGLIIGLIALFFQAFSMKSNMPWQTMIFTALVLGRMAVVVAVRSEYDSILKIGFFTNKPLIGAVLLTTILQLSVIYIPSLNRIFRTEPLSFDELLLTLFASSIIFFFIEIEKFIKRRNG